ncbi:MAG: fumarylacetoacetate hydrolase family protein [Deltaproteobacteria bacterium]|nr:fumarylacetoacetate hydrolase family protein [Deltaproteobacteria bacterium]
MRLLTFTPAIDRRLGALLKPDLIIGLQEAYACYLRVAEKNVLGRELASILIPNDMTAFLRGGDRSLEAARRASDFVVDRLASRDEVEAFRRAGILHDESEVRIHAPVPRPGAVISAGKNFSDHVGEMSTRSAPAFPVAFPKMPHTITGPTENIPYPKETEKLDYEVELAIVIGKPCHNVRKEEAFEYVAGYTAFNDISARDVIRRENETGIFLMGKNFPGFSPMGPCLVLRDEVPDPQSLKLESRVNGEVRQSSDLSYMIFKIADLIAYWSQIGLKPGDIITSGTPRGVAAGRKEGQSPWWLRPGDLVEAEVETIGCLRNRIVPEP